jgi:manganese transport protein
VVAVRNPPRGLFASLRHLGPGLILSAAIVGSGELIATTALGAKAGYVLLWVIPLSCLMKVTLQVEYGRQCILRGQSTFGIWNTGNGLRFRGLHWSVCAALLFMATVWLGMAGVIGAASQVLVHAFPGSRVEWWVGATALLLALLVFHGKYGPIEKIATFLNCVFVAAIIYCNVATQSTAYAYNLDTVTAGFSFRLPHEGIGLAVAVFGITGVASGEIIMYVLWCLEKGYAAWTGPYDGSAEWAARARGWIRVMKTDALLSLAVYTLTTCGFYLLGASVLHSQGTIADGNELIFQLSGILTNVLGPGSVAIFMLCAFSVLFGTMFSNVAGQARMWADMLPILGLGEATAERRRKVVRVLSWVQPALWAVTYVTFQKPLGLVVFMGVMNAVFLLVVAWQGVVFRYERPEPALDPSRAYDAALWLSIASIAAVAAMTLRSLVGGK